MEQRVKQLLGRLEEVETLLGDPAVVQDQARYKKLTREHSYLNDVKHCYEILEKDRADLKGNLELLQEDNDPEFSQILEEDVARLEKDVEKNEKKLDELLVPPDPRDHHNTIIELRAGTGGDEAALFVADCVRMYQMFADQMKWKVELLSCTPSDLGGFREYVMVLSGANVHRFLQYEGGTHRVQRVPETETQGRVHTSAITLAILEEPTDDIDIKVDEKDLKIDTYRASGAGGQHVNTTDSAIRITHMPTGIVVHCQEERSQHKNKDKAMRFLKAKLLEAEEEKKRKEQSDSRSAQVGTGDRSERIRTYNFPQNRLTDHRINLTKYNLDRVMEGDLEEIVLPLVAYFHQLKLNAAQ
ncbi:MAG: peptide chain release factor 1 [Chlamydiia bacterium]|nr:peptide chain release factor 1 [Chlamydiia bacterium]